MTPGEPQVRGEARARELRSLLVCPAAHLRPLVPQIHLATGHSFTYDAVYTPSASGRDAGLLFDECVKPLVDSVLQGWNATVLAYGQTGSGKTFTMGTAPGAQQGIVPCAVAHVFDAAGQPGFGDCTVAVSFIEMYQEDIRDLLADGAAHSSHSVTLRDVPGSSTGAAHLPDARLVTCTSPAHVASVLARGAACRVTAATGMNAVSSRSHAVVTLHVSRTCEEGSVSVTRRSKLHLVDLAGSERVKRTGAEGSRFAEGVHINRGLLALGNVISALGDDTRRRTGGHVPYRDSKLTRLLADALGGNSRTVFLACISPSDASADETLSTLKYANRARNITNKAARESGTSGAATAEEAAQLRAALAAATAELARMRGAAAAGSLVETGGRPLAEAAARVQRAEAALCVARLDIAQLKDEVALAQQEALHACVSRDAALVRLHASLDGDADKENDGKEASTVDVLSAHLRSLARLRSRVRRLTAQLLAAGVEPDDGEDADADGDGAAEEGDVQLGPLTLAALSSDGITSADTAREYEAHRAACTAQLDALDAALCASEEQQRTLSTQLGGGEASAGEVVAHYELLLTNMEAERTALLEERQRLLAALGDSAARAPAAKGAMSEQHLRAQLRSLEAKLGELQRKLRDAADAEAARRAMSVKGAALAAEVQRLKIARAELARRMERDAKAHLQAARQAALALGAERAQARKAAAKAAQAGAQADKAEAVLRRKMEEVAVAQKTIAALRAARRSGSKSSGAPAEVEAKPSLEREPLAPVASMTHGDGWMQAALASGPASGWNNVRSLQEARMLLAAMAASSGAAASHVTLAEPAPAAGVSRAAAAHRPRPRKAVQRRWRNADEPDSGDDASGGSVGGPASSWDATARRASSSEEASLDEVSSAAAGGAAVDDASATALASFLRANATPTGNKRPPFRLAPATPPPAAMAAADAADTPRAASSAADDDLLASARASRQRAASLLFSVQSPGSAAMRTPLRSLALNDGEMVATEKQAFSPVMHPVAALDC